MTPLRAVRWLVLLMWPSVTWAASVTLGLGFGEMGVSDIAAVIGLASFSGAVAMLQRMDRERTATVPSRWMMTHMLTALLAGLMAFLVCEIYDFGNWQEALTILAASWGGTRYVDLVFERMLGGQRTP